MPYASCALILVNNHMSEILIGTSGFYYDDWKGEFYPQETLKKDYLEYYARNFKVLELNSTYYRIPGARQSTEMIKRSSGILEFVVKASRQLTHEISDNSISDFLPLFIKGIFPFMEQDLLGSVLLQFPQSFHYTSSNRLYLKSLIETLSPAPVSIEFRQKEWLKDSVFETLRQLGAGFVSGDELKEWLPKISELADKTKKLFVFFNNHARAQAVTNARMLINLLKDVRPFSP